MSVLEALGIKTRRRVEMPQQFFNEIEAEVAPVYAKPEEAIVAAIEAGFEKLACTVENVLSAKFRSVAGSQLVEALEKRLDRKFETISESLAGYVQSREELRDMNLECRLWITGLRKDLDAIMSLFERLPAKPAEELPFEQLVDRDTGELSPKLAELTASGRTFKVVVEPVPARLELRMPTVGRRPPA